MERHHPTRAQPAPRPAQQVSGLRNVHQDPPSDDSIEVVARLQAVELAVVERDVRPARRRHPVPRGVEDLGVHVDPDHLALGADQFRCQQCNVAGATTHLEHLHPDTDACSDEELAGQRTIDLMLQNQPLRLSIRATKRVVVVHVQH